MSVSCHAGVLFLRRCQIPLGPYILVSSRKGVVCVKTEVQSPDFFARWEREKAVLRDDDGLKRKEALLGLEAAHSSRAGC